VDQAAVAARVESKWALRAQKIKAQLQEAEAQELQATLPSLMPSFRLFSGEERGGPPPCAAAAAVNVTDEACVCGRLQLFDAPPGRRAVSPARMLSSGGGAVFNLEATDRLVQCLAAIATGIQDT
jgi:hypothetical protein